MPKAPRLEANHLRLDQSSDNRGGGVSMTPKMFSQFKMRERD
jgi:hypothetical protein